MNFFAANVAVSNSKTLSGTPPVLTFSKTVQTASLGVALVKTITGTWYVVKFARTSFWNRSHRCSLSGIVS